MKIETEFNIGQTIWCASRQRLEGIYDIKIEKIEIEVKEDFIEIIYQGKNSNLGGQKHKMWARDYECFDNSLTAQKELNKLKAGNII